MISENKQQNTAQKTQKKKDKTYKKFTVDFNQAVSNNLLTLENASKYLAQNIKLKGLKGKLGDSIKVHQTEKKDKQKNTLVVSVENSHDIKFSKRYIKYLVKKFLKREILSLYLRVISNGQNSYIVKLFQRNVE